MPFKIEYDPELAVRNLGELLKFGGSVASPQLANTQGTMTQDGVTHILKLCEALWIHSGDPQAPHVELTYGLHSDIFVDVLRALKYPNVCDILAYHMVSKIEDKLDEIDYPSTIDWVIGSDHAGAVFSQNVARWLGAQHDFTKKGPNKTQSWKRFEIKPDEAILQVEELMTTARTMLTVREGVRSGNPNPVTFAPLVATLVHRSSVYNLPGEAGDVPVVYLAHYDSRTWEKGNCALCQAGSKAIKEPKKNWRELTGK